MAKGPHHKLQIGVDCGQSWAVAPGSKKGGIHACGLAAGHSGDHECIECGEKSKV